MCEADLEKALSSLETCRHDFKEKDAKLHQLTSELRTHCAEKEHLQKVIGQHQQSQERVCQEFDYRMFTLRVRVSVRVQCYLHFNLVSECHSQFEGGEWLS